MFNPKVIMKELSTIDWTMNRSNETVRKKDYNNAGVKLYKKISETVTSIMQLV